MKRIVHIEINSDVTRCASAPGEFCPWVRVRRFGQEFVCGLFDGAQLQDGADGWLQRLPECVEAERREP